LKIRIPFSAIAQAIIRATISFFICWGLSSEKFVEAQVSSSTNNIRVVATVKPIYAITAQLLDGITHADLLFKNRGSAHHLTLSTEEIRRAINADVIIWVGPTYEFSLAGIIKKSIKIDHLITLEQANGLSLLDKRSDEDLFPGCAHTHHHEHELDSHEEHEHHTIDGHFWLDLDNLKACARHIVTTLSLKYPEHQEKLESNLSKLLEKIDVLSKELDAIYAPIKGKNAFIDHDCLQYLEKRYGFTIKGALQDSDLPPSTIHIKRFIDYLEKQKNAQPKTPLSALSFSLENPTNLHLLFWRHS